MMTGMLGLCAAVLGALAAVGWVVAVADSAPNLTDLRPHDPHPPSEIFAADGTPLGYIHTDTIYSPVPSSRIPNRLRQATVAIEDRRFYQHGALDYQGILRAGIKDLFGQGNALQGASTLTMQLVDNNYIDGTKYAVNHDLKYKIVQAKLAQQLEKKHSKSWILDAYLNVVPYGTVGGEEAEGVGAASQMFFDEPVWKLNLAQMALLAGLPQAPSQYNPLVEPGLAHGRRHNVLEAMVKSHYITQAQANRANAQPLQVHPNTTYSVIRQPYVFDFVRQQLDEKLCPQTPDHCPAVTNGGLKVYTTLDLKKQAEAESAIAGHEGGPVLDNQPAAALVSIDPSNGNILAMANSSTYSQTSFNFAADAHRQSGSAFKPFALMTLIHDYDGDPNQTYYNSHFLQVGWLPQDPTWSVHTAEETYQGNISVAKATTVSDNTVFAQLAADLGWDKLDQMAHAMGITSPLDGNPAEVIGGQRIGVTPLEMADAYATISNGGYHMAPTIISKIVFPDGSVMNLSDPPKTQVFSSGQAYAATQVLKTVITSGTGTAADFGCPAAGKTGTAENMDNAWFVGYTPQLSTAVWVGYPQGNVPMGDGFGGVLAAPIWHDYMAAASDGFCGDFPQPSDQWSGTQYNGPRSVSSGGGNGNGSGNGNYSGNGTGGTTYQNPYNNPTLYPQPPQSAPTTGGAGTGAGAGGGAGGGGGGNAGGGGGTGGGGGGGGGGTGGGGGGTGGGGGHHGRGGGGGTGH